MAALRAERLHLRTLRLATGGQSGASVLHRVADAAGLPLAMAERLQGDDREALEADAQTFAPFLQATPAPFMGTAAEEHARLVADLFGPGHGR